MTSYLTQFWGRFVLSFLLLCLLVSYAQSAQSLRVLYVYDDSAPRPFAGKVEIVELVELANVGEDALQIRPPER